MPDVRVIEGDCLAVLPTLEVGLFDAVITDPPYGISLANHGGKTPRKDRRSGAVRADRLWRIEGDEDQEAALTVMEWAEINRVCLAMFASPYRPLPGEWRNILVWDKGPATGGGGDIRTCWKRTFEMIYIRDNGPLSGNREAAVLKHWVSPNFRGDCRLHPAAKPVDLLRYLVRKLTPPGGIVLDPFLGSGTTAVACLREGRSCVGIEREPAYVEIARKRIAAELDPGPLFAGLTTEARSS